MYQLAGQLGIGYAVQEGFWRVPFGLSSVPNLVGILKATAWEHTSTAMGKVLKAKEKMLVWKGEGSQQYIQLTIIHAELCEIVARCFEDLPLEGEEVLSDTE